MTKFYYSWLPSAAILVAILSASFFPARSQYGPPPLRTASLESHEGLTISARPWTTAAEYKEKFPKKSPFEAGLLGILVEFRNETDQTLRVGIDRIRLTVQLDEEHRQEVQPLTAAQVADAVLRPGAKDPRKPKVPLPLPLPGGNSDKKFIELQQQAQDAGVPGGVISPHGKVQGLLYFDLQHQFDLLSTAHLYIPAIAVIEKNSSLTFFEIDLSRSGN